MIGAVLDTNVLASGFLGRDGTPDRILRRWDDGAFDLITSEAILHELERTLAGSYFRQRISENDAAEALLRLRQSATLVDTPALPEPTASHPEDDRILSTALSGGADYLVTGDAQLRRLNTFHGVVIVTPREFLDLLPTRSANDGDGIDDPV